MLSSTRYGRTGCFEDRVTPRGPVPNSLLCAAGLKMPHRGDQYNGQHLFPINPTDRMCWRSTLSHYWNMWGSGKGVYGQWLHGKQWLGHRHKPCNPGHSPKYMSSNTKDSFNIIWMDVESGLDTESRLDVTTWTGNCTNWPNCIQSAWICYCYTDRWTFNIIPSL